MSNSNVYNLKLFRICAFGCQGSEYQFDYFHIYNIQKLDLITIYHWSDLQGYETLGLFNGVQTISNINISYNNIMHLSVFLTIIHIQFLVTIILIIIILFRNFICIYFSSWLGILPRSNIILNKSPNGGLISVFGNGKYNLTESIFDKNHGLLLNAYLGSLLLINCYYLTGSSSTFASVSGSLINTNTNYYEHSIYFTFYCSYENPPIQTFNPTISENVYLKNLPFYILQCQFVSVFPFYYYYYYTFYMKNKNELIQFQSFI